MNRILLSLFLVLIALAGIACASASSDFDDSAVEINQDFYGINETVEPINEDFDDVIENDPAEEQDPADIIIDNSTEEIENNTEDNQIPADITIENNTEDNQIPADISIENNTQDDDLKSAPIVYDASSSKLQPRINIEVLDLDIKAPKISTGDRIDDAIVYYSAYYDVYHAILPFGSMDIMSTIALIYQEYNEKDTIDIVAGILYMKGPQNALIKEAGWKLLVEIYFYEIMYYDPNHIPDYTIEPKDDGGNWHPHNVIT